MGKIVSRIGNAIGSLPTRATLVLLCFVSAGIAVMAWLGYTKVDDVTQQNAAIRIDRAARAAAIITAKSYKGIFNVICDNDGKLLAIDLAPSVGPDVLKITPEFDDLVEKIAQTNQGIANIFRFNIAKNEFERFATTLRKPDGTPARDASLGQGHPAFSSLIQGRHFTGNVPVLGRFRLAYLTPIRGASGKTVGALAVDVGWVDDLLRAKAELQTSILQWTAVLILVVAALGALLLNFQFRPLRTLGRFAHRIAAGEERGTVPYMDRKDEIGKLAGGISLVVKVQAEKEKILKDMHDGIGGIATNIKLLSDLAQKGSNIKDMRSALKTISGLSQEGLTEIRGFIQSLDIKDTNWQDMAAELRGFGSNMIKAYNLSFNMKASLEDIEEKPSSLLYLNLFRTYKEALTNIIKHSKAKSVDVLFSVNKERIALSVKDDGIGLKEDKKGRGRGISNMTMRAKELGGQLTIFSDKGTNITFEIPM